MVPTLIDGSTHRVIYADSFPLIVWFCRWDGQVSNIRLSTPKNSDYDIATGLCGGHNVGLFFVARIGIWERELLRSATNHERIQCVSIMHRIDIKTSESFIDMCALTACGSGSGKITFARGYRTQVCNVNHD